MSGIKNNEDPNAAYDRTHRTMFGYVNSWVHKTRKRQLALYGAAGLVGAGGVAAGVEHFIGDGVDTEDITELATLGAIGLLVGVIINLAVQQRIFLHRQSAYKDGIRGTLGTIGYGQDPSRGTR